MPLPIILGVAAAVAATTGVGTGIHGAVKMKEADGTSKLAKRIHEDAIEKFKTRSKDVTTIMDDIGRKELKSLDSFKKFSSCIEKIQNKPEFGNLSVSGVDLPKYKEKEIEDVSLGAGILLGGVGGAAVGTLGGFASAGMTTAAVMAIGTASTGTAISSLSGIAATNATMAALGGGSLAVGGGGIALGTTILGAATLGVGLLIGGIIFNGSGNKLSDQADEAYGQATKTKEEVDSVCLYLDELEKAAIPFKEALIKVRVQYKKNLSKLEQTVLSDQKTDWDDFDDEEKINTENTVLLVGLLLKMCRVKLVLKEEDMDGINQVNTKDITKAVSDAKTVMKQKFGENDN